MYSNMLQLVKLELTYESNSNSLQLMNIDRNGFKFFDLNTIDSNRLETIGIPINEVFPKTPTSNNAPVVFLFQLKILEKITIEIAPKIVVVHAINTGIKISLENVIFGTSLMIIAGSEIYMMNIFNTCDVCSGNIFIFLRVNPNNIRNSININVPINSRFLIINSNNI